MNRLKSGKITLVDLGRGRRARGRLLAKRAGPRIPRKSIPAANAITSEKLKARAGSRAPLAVKALADLARRIRMCVKCPLHASRTICQKPGGGTYGTARTGSATTAATSPSFSST